MFFLCPVIIRQMRSLQIHSCEGYIFYWTGDIATGFIYAYGDVRMDDPAKCERAFNNM